MPSLVVTVMCKFSITSLNVRSVRGQARQILLRDFMAWNQSRIWLIQETHLRSHYALLIKDFNVFRCDRVIGNGGGTAIIVHASIPIRNYKTFTKSMEATSVECLINGAWVQVVSCYISPGCAPSDAHTTAFYKFLNNHDFCLLGGDFNARDTNWGDPSSNSLGVWLLQFSQNYNFHIINPESPTSYRSENGTYIDKFLSRNVLTEHSVKTKASFSDHHAIETYSLFVASNTVGGGSGGSQTLQTIKVFSWTKVHQLNKFLLDEFEKLYLPVNCNLTGQQIDELCSKIDKLFQFAIERFVPVRQINFAKITLAHDTRHLRQRLRCLLRKHNRNKFAATSIVQAIKGDIRLHTSLLLQYIKRDIANHYSNVLLNIDDIYSFYHSVGSRKRSSKFANISELTNDENRLTVKTDVGICKMFAQHFAKNHQLTVHKASAYDAIVKRYTDGLSDNSRRHYCFDISNTSPAIPYLPPSSSSATSSSATTTATVSSPSNNRNSSVNSLNSSSKNVFVTSAKVQEVIMSRNSKPSSGIDMMPNRLLKFFDPQLFHYVAILFNQILAAGHFPLSWKHAIVIPIPKAGKPIKLVSNWRPISLLNSLSKVFERIVAGKINSFIDDVFENQQQLAVIPHHQFGFQSAHSTYHPLAILQNKINMGLNQKCCTTVISLDIRAAFDTVWHDGLVYKLHKLKFPMYLIRILQSFLRNRSFQVKFANILSDRKWIPAGVPQGSVLGPILFNLSNYDIPTSEHFTLLQYADDTAIAITYPRIHRIERNINVYLAKLSDWYSAWKFQLNESKTDMIHFVGTQEQVSWLRRRRLRALKVHLNGVQIQPKANIRYLGVNFSRNNRFNYHIDLALRKTLAAKAKLGAMVHSQLLKTDFRRFLYTVYLRPILTYASPIWLNPSQITSWQVERCRMLERKLIRSTHNIYRRRHDYKYINNKKLYEIFGYQRIDAYMAKLSINFHTRCSISKNPEICKLYSVYDTNVNFARGYFHRTDYITALHENNALFNAKNELTLFNRKKFAQDMSVYSLAQ